MNALESDEVSGSRAFLSRCAVGVFVAFHVIALAQHIMPSSGLGKTFSFELNRLTHASDYMRAISSEQRWGLFSPNPSFANIFVQVLVEVDNGEIVDLRHDIYRNRKHPYLFYDRFGKINRSVYEHPRYRAPYAAWVCRDWALTAKCGWVDPAYAHRRRVDELA